MNLQLVVILPISAVATSSTIAPSIPTTSVASTSTCKTITQLCFITMLTTLLQQVSDTYNEIKSKDNSWFQIGNVVVVNYARLCLLLFCNLFSKEIATAHYLVTNTWHMTCSDEIGDKSQGRSVRFDLYSTWNQYDQYIPMHLTKQNVSNKHIITNKSPRSTIVVHSWAI